MKDYKTDFCFELRKTQREGIEDLITGMSKGGFFDAPCSGEHHLCEPGGLLEHSMNVLEIARKLNKALNAKIPDTSIVITALLHDLGKMGDHDKPNYVENILKSGKQSDAKPFITNKELQYVPHEVRSVVIAERYIKLTEDEESAILYHNGLYGDFKYDIKGNETPLYLILHDADMWASRVVEVEGKEKKEGKEG